jgi:hypothetical protein
VAAGLYRNSEMFAGWERDGAAFDFDTPITANITLTAKFATAPTITLGAGNAFEASVTYILANIGPEYTLVLGADALNTAIASAIATDNFKLTVVGKDSERKISTTTVTGSPLVTLGATGKSGISLTIGNNVTLQGVAANTKPVVTVAQGATFTMLAGSKITGNTNTTAMPGDPTTAVTVGGFNSVFIMKGGNITANTGLIAVSVGNAGKFVMEGSSVSGNTNGTNYAGDVICTADADTATTSMTLSGAAGIGTLMLTMMTSTTTPTPLTVSPAWTGAVTKLSLFGANAAIATVKTWWTGKTVLKASSGSLTPALIAKVPLGDFVKQDTLGSTAISGSISTAGALAVNP